MKPHILAGKKITNKIKTIPKTTNGESVDIIAVFLLV
jgi:hypothetical protein